jgi:hypothetical protein
MNPLTQSKNTSILPVLIALTLVCFALSPQARAVCQQDCLGNQNTVLGNDALIHLGDLGVANTAIGYFALERNTDGSYNTGIGAFALQFNTTGIENTAIGYGALPYNTTGQYNTANGRSALYANTTGNNNTASGYLAMEQNINGDNNTATGREALRRNLNGDENTAIGHDALLSNKSGFGNTGCGVNALSRNTFGSRNIALGMAAGTNVTGDNNIVIGNPGIRDEANAIHIGDATHTATFIAAINGATVPTGVAVIVDSSGHLGTTTSSARFKENIQPMENASEAILALEPVTFHYKKELDPEAIPQFGLVAEEVEKVNPDLVARDDQGKPYTVRYEAVNMMLLNEFLKEHRKVEQLEKQVAALTAGLQKVSAELELSKPAPRTVVNNQ